VGLILRYVQNTKTGKRYRRRVPERLQPFMEITEFTRFLGLTEREALRAYPGIHAECEKEFDLAEGKASGNPTEDAPKIPTTEFDQYRALITELRARGADPEKEAYDLDDPAGEVEWNTRSRAADAILDEYPIDPETGDPVGVTAADLALVRALNWKAPPPPPPTFEDATRRYIKDKGLDKDGSDKNRERVDRVARHVRAALGRDLPLPRLRRQDAREVMDYMLDDAGITSPATVERYLNDVRAIINHAIVEFDLSTYKNPFTKLNPPTKGPAKNARNPFTEKWTCPDLVERLSLCDGHYGLE
jgi:hypothetical protein